MVRAMNPVTPSRTPSVAQPIRVNRSAAGRSVFTLDSAARASITVGIPASAPTIDTVQPAPATSNSTVADGVPTARRVWTGRPDPAAGAGLPVSAGSSSVEASVPSRRATSSRVSTAWASSVALICRPSGWAISLRTRRAQSTCR